MDFLKKEVKPSCLVEFQHCMVTFVSQFDTAMPNRRMFHFILFERLKFSIPLDLEADGHSLYIGAFARNRSPRKLRARFKWLTAPMAGSVAYKKAAKGKTPAPMVSPQQLPQQSLASSRGIQASALVVFEFQLKLEHVAAGGGKREVKAGNGENI